MWGAVLTAAEILRASCWEMLAQGRQASKAPGLSQAPRRGRNKPGCRRETLRKETKAYTKAARRKQQERPTTAVGFREGVFWGSGGEGRQRSKKLELRATLKDRQQAVKRLDGEARSGPSGTLSALQAAGRPLHVPAPSVWPGAQPLPSLGL